MIDISYRVIADHARCLTFALTDGAVPDREGRGYVLRRILRRAVRYGWQYLNMHKPFLYKLVDTVVAVMGGAFPELKKNPQRVKEIIREEEESFEKTLDRGIALFDEAAEFATKRHHGEIRGEDAFKLHDTYGFPIDLTQVMAEEKGLKVDIGEYERLMEEARERARAGDKADIAVNETLEYMRVNRIVIGKTTFTGHDSFRGQSTVQHIVKSLADGAVAARDIKAGERGALILRNSPFYPEKGGQVGDKGDIRGPNGLFRVEDTQNLDGISVHLGHCESGRIELRELVTAEVDESGRRRTMQNHTATHVMNWALREVLGEHVQQKGSLVDPEKTRFDFSHPKALTPEELERVEQLVNEAIAQDLPVHDKVIEQDQALKVNGLRAIFGERYPDMVRVMSIGVAVEKLVENPGESEWQKYSIEFCGGTHVKSTGQIERFALASEEAVAKGIRRVVGLTGEAAKRIEEAGAALVQQAEQLSSGPAEQVPQGLSELQSTLASAQIPVRHRAKLRELIAELQKTAKKQHKADAVDAATVVRAQVDKLLAAAEKIGDTTIVVDELPDLTLDQLKVGADMIKQKCDSAAMLLGARAGGKALLVAAMTPDLIKRGLKAGDLIKHVAPIVKGGGGGPPTMAQAGGKDPDQLPAALAAAHEWLAGKL